jgi:NADP-dependent 3-hydroxy acid dehydrogenase YdfG
VPLGVGVGARIAEVLVEAGVSVVLTDVSHEAGRAVADRLGESASYEPLDVIVEGDWTLTCRSARMLLDFIKRMRR